MPATGATVKLEHLAETSTVMTVNNLVSLDTVIGAEPNHGYEPKHSNIQKLRTS